MGIYQTATIIRNCHYIENSLISRSDCNSSDLNPMMQSYQRLQANITTANVDYLPLLTIEAGLVEIERVDWMNQFANLSQIQNVSDWQVFQQRVANDTLLKNTVRKCATSLLPN